MGPSAQHLALRDPARAAILGIIGAVASEQGFGYESPNVGADPFGLDVGEVVGADVPFGAEFGAMIPFGADFGAAAAAGAQARPNPHNPQHHPALLAAWHAQNMKKAGTKKRANLLNPNQDSDIKIEKYVFSLNPSQFGSGSSLVWGTVNSFVAFKNPQVAFRAERMFINVTQPGVVYISTIQAANVQAQIGATADAFTFSPYAAAGSHVSLPTLPPQNTMQVTGTWTNVVPAPFTPGVAFTLAIDFQGWATIVA